ncbi:kinase-like protein [Trametes coccinea BRFM310]|uniref:Kinase-like protein n=1 Tax=Trametes coccinea (strain BRFM310) TaxID=1353009 RepID=A0A1Y2J0R6_TRAC3|nr:kinase-like protein [Trametes coccinea BRFM310]
MSASTQPPQSNPSPKRIIHLPSFAPLEEGGLNSNERFWRDHWQWFNDRGYVLRRRYHPDWVPSWKDTNRDPEQFEDGLEWFRSHLMDAKRLSDGVVVVMKLIKKSVHPYEAEISQMFSTEPLASDPHNHCVPIYDVLESPLNNDVIFLVMPFLRDYNNPRFATVGEGVECVRQLLEGVHFLHQQHVAHRDIMNFNFMMDPAPLVSEPYHPHMPTRSYDTRRKVKVSTRTKHPVKYYLIDFGISRKYPADCASPREDPIWGGIKKVPEFHKSNEPCDPFPTDVFYVGYLLWEDFVEKCPDFEFMRPLVMDMMQEDPEKRPTMGEVVERFDKLRLSLSTWKLRSRFVHRKDSIVFGFFRALRHTYRTIEYIITRLPPIPTPSSG